MLQSIFISHHFDDDAKELAGLVTRLVSSHNLRPVTGKRLAGKPLSQEVRELMDEKYS